MPINSPNMLAPISLQMEEMQDLLGAEQPEIELLIEHAEKIRLECSVSTCADTIARYERIFNLPSSNRPLEERRAALIFLINSRLLVTKEYMQKLLGDVLSCTVWIEEQFAMYSFVVSIDGGGKKSPDFEAASRYLRVLKPAHLQGILRYRQTINGFLPIASFGKVGLRMKIEPYQMDNLQAMVTIKSKLYAKQGVSMLIHPKGE